MDNFSSLDNLTSLSLTLINNTYITHDCTWYESKTRMDYALWNIIEGNIWLTVNNKEFFVTSGDVILFYPGDYHTAHTDEQGCKFIYNCFSLEIKNGIDIMATLNFSGIVPKEYISKKCLSFCEAFIDNHHHFSPNSLSVYVMFIAYLNEIIEIKKTKDCPCFDSIALEQKTLLNKIVTYINENYHKSLSINALAQLAEMNEKYFITYFKANLSISPKQYIIQCRMREAQTLLLHSDKAISEIAELVGYSDGYAFSKAFKKYFTQSPTEFKKYYYTTLT